jgi:hypothetical protein
MLQSYFEKDPERWIYDFLSENAELEEVVLDFTPLIGCPAVSSTSNNTGTKSSTKRGQLLVGLCNAIKDEIFNLERESQKKKNDSPLWVHATMVNKYQVFNFTLG